MYPELCNNKEMCGESGLNALTICGGSSMQRPMCLTLSLLLTFLYCYSLYQFKVLATGQNMARAQMTWQLPTLESRVLTEKLLAIQLIKFPCHLWNLNLHYNFHTKSQLNHNLCQMNPTQNFAHSFLKTDFSINPVPTKEVTWAKFPRKNFKQAAPQYRLTRRSPKALS